MAQELEPAVAGDRITGEELQSSIDHLRQMANELDALKTDASSVAEIQSISQTQAKLRSMAGALVVQQIDLVVGEARVTAEHIESAVRFADGVIQSIADIRQRLAKIGSLLTFFGAVLTGNGATIVKAAFTLKDALA